MSSFIAAGRATTHVVGRSATEYQVLVGMLRANPHVWHVYSTHVSNGAAMVRCSQLRRRMFPKHLLELYPHVEFKKDVLGTHGPVVLVRYAPPS